jgi:signal recognition particle subunit SRP19
MRQQDRIIVWPAYFDVARTRRDGRRVPRDLAVPSPRVSEIKEAADRLRLENESVPDRGYSRAPWMKTGMLLVRKKEPKDKTLIRIAQQLAKTRAAQVAQAKK